MSPTVERLRRDRLAVYEEAPSPLSAARLGRVMATKSAPGRHNYEAALVARPHRPFYAAAYFATRDRTMTEGASTASAAIRAGVPFPDGVVAEYLKAASLSAASLMDVRAEYRVSRSVAGVAVR